MYLFTIKPEHVGKTTVELSCCHACGQGRTICLSSAIGRVQLIDIGKRVYSVSNESGASRVIQVENDAQRDMRQTAESACNR